MKVKTSELSWSALDWAVAKSLGFEGFRRLKNSEGSILVLRSFNPSGNWEQGGRIIERFKIDIAHLQDGCVAYMHFSNDDDDIVQRSEERGESELIAAMRCFVASKLGDEVQVPYDIVHG
jgi:hypothetical protein